MKHVCFLACLGLASGTALVTLAACSSDDATPAPFSDPQEAGTDGPPGNPDAADAPTTDSSDAAKGDAALPDYCTARLAYDARCLTTLTCNTATVCKTAEPFTSPAWIAATIACEAKATACDDTFTCQAEAAKAAPLTASQKSYVHSYCTLCRPADAAACEASPFVGKSESMSIALTVGATILDQANLSCFDPDLDAGTAADGGALTCDQRVARCSSAIAKTKLPNIVCHTK